MRTRKIDRSFDCEYHARRLGFISAGHLESIARQGSPVPVPIAGTDLHAYNGMLVESQEMFSNREVVQGMAGFSTIDSLSNALTTGKGQWLSYQKNSFTTVSTQVYDYWLATGTPTNGAFGTALTGTIPTKATAGALPYTNPTGPATMHLVALQGISGVAVGTVFLYDRVAEYPLNGTVTSGTWGTQPALTRDANGSSLGDGILMFVENVGATANTAQTLNITYTNSGGTGSHTTGAQTLKVGAISTNRVINPTDQWWYPLQGADVGVRSIQSYVLGASATSTTINVVLARPLVFLPILAANASLERDCVLQLPSLDRIYDDSALSMLLMAGTTTSPINAMVRIAQN